MECLNYTKAIAQTDSSENRQTAGYTESLTVDEQTPQLEQIERASTASSNFQIDEEAIKGKPAILILANSNAGFL